MSNFFTVEERNGHWWFIDPTSQPFWSIGMNHLDSASLRYAENLHIWRVKYTNSQQRWIQEGAVPDLKAWGYNTIGWTQEVIIRGVPLHRHSRAWTYEEYQWADMPYCELLPFVEFHQWELETIYPPFDVQWEDWCDCVARDVCARMADDPKLIGYFYSDCPTWIHAWPDSFKGPLFDPARLASQAGRDELTELATRYYQVTHDAIRRYDPNHLILGDRYEAARPMAQEVVQAAVPYVDVLSFQHFRPAVEVIANMRYWHDLTGLPCLLADACVPGRDQNVALGDYVYPQEIKQLREEPCCVGWHYCGAYLRNRSRQAGFLDELEQGNADWLAAVAQANAETEAYVIDTATSAMPAQ